MASIKDEPLGPSSLAVCPGEPEEHDGLGDRGVPCPLLLLYKQVPLPALPGPRGDCLKLAGYQVDRGVVPEPELLDDLAPWEGHELEQLDGDVREKGLGVIASLKVPPEVAQVVLAACLASHQLLELRNADVHGLGVDEVSGGVELGVWLGESPVLTALFHEDRAGEDGERSIVACAEGVDCLKGCLLVEEAAEHPDPP